LDVVWWLPSCCKFYAILVFLSIDSSSQIRSLITVAFFPHHDFLVHPRRFRGGIVGYERREADRPAGIRTMSLVSLGACLFSINSAFAFLDGPMSWDSSRIAAAIPSGVGFLGAGLIFKEAEKNKKSGDTTHVVHGLTTAASLWIVSDA